MICFFLKQKYPRGTILVPFFLWVHICFENALRRSPTIHVWYLFLDTVHFWSSKMYKEGMFLIATCIASILKWRSKLYVDRLSSMLSLVPMHEIHQFIKSKRQKVVDDYPP